MKLKKIISKCLIGIDMLIIGDSCYKTKCLSLD